MRSGMRAAAFALSLVAGVNPVMAQEKLRLGTEGAYPPFSFIDASGKVGGFDVEIGLALCKEMRVECEVVAQDWDGIVPGLIAEKYDLIIASMSITEERKAKVAFTEPYYRSALAFAVPKDSPITDVTPVALAGKVIGVQSGTTHANYAANTFVHSDIREYPTQDEVNLDLANGRLDLQVGDYLSLLDWIGNADGASCCKFAGRRITDPAFVGEGMAIALRKEDVALRDKMNAALLAIRADGTYQAINKRYFSTDIFTME